VSQAAIQASLLLIRGALAGDPAALEIAAETGRAICDLTGATAEIVAEARAELLAEQEAERTSKPQWIGRAGGQLLAAPNHLYPGTRSRSTRPPARRIRSSPPLRPAGLHDRARPGGQTRGTRCLDLLRAPNARTAPLPSRSCHPAAAPARYEPDGGPVADLEPVKAS
jgi:hypothetical protein